MGKVRKGHDKRLLAAVDTIAEIIDDTAKSLKKDLSRGEDKDLRQLKELTSAAKELAAVMKNLGEGESKETEKELRVVFEGDGDDWAT